MATCITQLIYINSEEEASFLEFENTVLPLMEKYNGTLLLRVRPSEQEVIDQSIETPFEIHIIEFESDLDFKNYLNDETRKKFLHLKEKSIRSSLVIKGIRM